MRPNRVVDPTSELLTQITNVRSTVPWRSLALALLAALSIPSLLALGPSDPRPHEQTWLDSLRAPAVERGSSSQLAHLVSRLGGAAGLAPRAQVPPTARLPAFLASFAALAVLFLAGRRVVGSAAALLAAAMLACCVSWRTAATSVAPWMLGELLVLGGVLYALRLQGRHREVELAGATASRTGVAGVLFGVGLLLAPSSVAAMLATIVIWLSLGLWRSRSEATVLPVERPGEITFFALFGTALLGGAVFVAAWGAERLAGGAAVPLATTFDPHLWHELYRRLLSPDTSTDLVLGAGAILVVGIRSVELVRGRRWEAGGLVPWLFVGGHVWTLTAAVAAGERLGVPSGPRLDVPVNFPPFFVLGLGWLLLRGLEPGRVHRQEYTFLMTWLLLGVACVPVVASFDSLGPELAATLGVLPPALLVASRGTRALWETHDSPLLRIALLVLAYVPLVAFALDAVAHVPVLQSNLVWILLGAVGLGILHEILTVRPDERPRRRIGPGRRRYRRGRGRAGTGRRGGARGGRKRRA